MSPDDPYARVPGATAAWSGCSKGREEAVGGRIHGIEITARKRVRAGAIEV